MYDMKALYEAYSVEEAVKLRLEHPEAQIIAGGTDVLVQMREGRRAGKELISIQKIDSMRGVSMDEDENIRIGSLTTFSHITRNPIIIEKINVLGEAVDMVGGPQIRNAGTIGGNTCNGVTSADSASTLHAWEAIVELTGVNGKRYLPIKDFYIKAGTVDINVAEGEIQTAILIPKASWENTKGFYIKYGMRNAMEIATTGCSVNVRLSGDKKTFDRVRIAYGVAGPVPMRAPSAEAVVNGQPVTMENIEAFSRAVLEDINPRDSWRASKAFRKHIAVEMAKRALIESVRLTSVKKGCEVGECGACTALIDGEAINTCLYLAVWAEGKHIITLEGLMNPDGTLSDVQKAFMEETSIQCGFCIPGFILTATEIVNSGKEYTDDELRKLLSGHLCRCTGYQNIFRAVKKTMLRRLGKNEEAELVR